MEGRERDELELVTHAAELLLERGDLGLGEVFLPVEGRRTVIREQLARELGVNGLAEAAGFLDVGLRGLEPQEVRVRRVGERARDRGLHAVLDLEEPLGRAVAREEAAVVILAVAPEPRRPLV